MKLSVSIHAARAESMSHLAGGGWIEIDGSAHILFVVKRVPPRRRWVD